MSATRTYLDYLHENIDICPANSQEELDAAELIQDIMSAHKLEVSQEDVSFAAWGKVINHALYVLLFLGVVLAGFIGTSMVYVGWGIALIAALLLFLEHKGLFKISQIGPRAQSQNVIAYHKGEGPLVMKGTRPIVVVAHYDTPHESILAQEQLAPYKARLMRLVPLSCVCALVCATFQLLNTLPFVSELACRVVWLVGILSAIPLLACGVDALYQMFSPCTEGANSNKSALASLLGIMDAVAPVQDAAKRWGEVEKHHGYSELSSTDDDTLTTDEEGGEGEEHEGNEEPSTPVTTEENIQASDVALPTSTAPIPLKGLTLKEHTPVDELEEGATDNTADSTSSLELTHTTAPQSELNENEALSVSAHEETHKEEDFDTSETSAQDAKSPKPQSPQTLELEYVFDVPEGVVRRGKETLEDLCILPSDCELIYNVEQKPLHPELLEQAQDAYKHEVFDHEGMETLTENNISTPEFLSREYTQVEDEGKEPLSPSSVPTRTTSRIRLSHESYDEDYPIAEWEACDEPQKDEIENQDAQETTSQTSHTDPEKTMVYTSDEVHHEEEGVMRGDMSPESTAVIENEDKEETSKSSQSNDISTETSQEMPVSDTFSKDTDADHIDAREMARRTALFDLPSPLEIPSDPFATGAVLNSSEDAHTSHLLEDADETPSFTRGSWKGGATPRQGLRVIEGGRAHDSEATPTDGEEGDTQAQASLVSLHNNPFVQEGVVDLFQSPKQEGDEESETPTPTQTTPAINAAEVLSEATTNHPEVALKASTQAQERHTSTPEGAPTEEELQESILSMGRDELICHDIWFVALGASTQQHAGMKAFLAEHRKDIRGAFLINLDGTGAGNLSILTHEGASDTRKCDRRLRRMMKQVAQSLHIELNEVNHNHASTDATEAMKTSMRSITLMGCDENGVCALRGTEDDVKEALIPSQAERVTNMVCELIRKS